MSDLKRAVIFDRDETLNFDPGYINDPDHFQLKPGVTTGLRTLQKMGYKIAVATNQAGIAKDKITEEQLEKVHEKMDELLAQAGVTIDGLFICKHKDEDECDCRKPHNGLMIQAIRKLNLDAKTTWVVGDRHRDLLAGADLGMRGILLPGKDTEEGIAPPNLVFSAKDFTAAVSFILESDFNYLQSRKIFSSYKDTAFQLWLQERRTNASSLVTTNGVFDLLHPGHVQYLYQASRLAEIFILGLNSDRSVTALKGPTRPVNKFDDRALVLSGFDFIDAIVQFDEDTPEEFLQVVQPQVHVKGGDYTIDSLPETRVVQSFGGEVIILPFRQGYSTTSILKRASHDL